TTGTRNHKYVEGWFEVDGVTLDNINKDGVDEDEHVPMILPPNSETHSDDYYLLLDDCRNQREVILSLNVHRRHLTAEVKRNIIGKLLKADPSKSDRQIAETVRADHKTVGAVRAEKEATGEIPQLKNRTGKDGKARKQPAKKKAPAATKSEPTDVPSDQSPWS